MGKLCLIPSTIGDTPVEQVIPPYNRLVIQRLRHFIVENERTARRSLIAMGIECPVHELKFYLLNKHTRKEEIPEFLKAAELHDLGLLSEAGAPAVADPGSEVVALAHKKNIDVIPLAGPSSLLMAIMGSGMNGQNFAFVGYLPVHKPERIRRIRQLEQRSISEKQSQIFIETPYRNNQVLDDLLICCAPNTMLCIASDLSTDTAFLKTRTIEEWINKKPDLNKRPTVFILHRF